MSPSPCSINCTEKTHTSLTNTNREEVVEITELREIWRVMEMKMMLMWAVSVSMLMMISCVDAAHKEPDMIKVGDSNNGWRPDVNYTVWASKHRFYVGDWLYFGFDRKMYDVLEVNELDYDGCRSDNPISIVSRGAGRDVFNLTSAKSFYFISSGGYCYHQMRVAVTAEEYTGPAITAPAPSPSKNGDGSPLKKNVIWTVIGAIVVGWTLVWNV